MKDYILLLLVTITSPLYSQIKVSGGVMGGGSNSLFDLSHRTKL